MMFWTGIETCAQSVARLPAALGRLLRPLGSYRELIEAALGRGRNAMAIWQDLVVEPVSPGCAASADEILVA